MAHGEVVEVWSLCAHTLVAKNSEVAETPTHLWPKRHFSWGDNVESRGPAFLLVESRPRVCCNGFVVRLFDGATLLFPNVAH